MSGHSRLSQRLTVVELAMLVAGSVAGGDPSSDFGWGGPCTPTLEQFREHLVFGATGGGSCVAPLAKMTAVWGLPESVMIVVFEMSDGTERVGLVTNGIVQVAWGGDIQAIGVTIDGLTASQADELNDLYNPDQPSCADLNAPASGGG